MALRAVGAVKSCVILKLLTSLQKIPASGKMGLPSKMTEAAPSKRGPNKIYEMPTTQPKLEVVMIVSCGRMPKVCSMEVRSPTALPPFVRTTPFGLPVDPLV